VKNSYISASWCTVDLNVGAFVRLCAMSFTILSSYSFIGHYTFRPNWPSSGVQVVMVKDSAARCNEGFFLLLQLPLVILVMWVAT
jgi:hypothetical protein